MAKTKAEQRLHPVSTEYVAYDKLDRDAVYAAIGCEESDSYSRDIQGIVVEILRECEYRWRNDSRIIGVKLSYRVGRDREVIRKVNVKDGTLSLSEIDRKIAELVQLKATDEERSRIQQAERDRATAKKQALKSEAEAEGLRFEWMPGASCRWGVVNSPLGLRLEAHSELSIEQAIEVQKLIESFQEVI